MIDYKCIKGCAAEFEFSDIFSVHPSVSDFAAFRLRCPVCFAEQRLDVDLATYSKMLTWRNQKNS